MKIKEIILICNNVMFYTKEEQDNFCECCKKISCIKKIEISKDKIEFYIQIIKAKNNIPYIFNSDLYLIKNIFERYKLSYKELIKFRTRDEITLCLKLSLFCTKLDQNILFKWITYIKTAKDIIILGNAANVPENYVICDFYTTKLLESDLQNLACISDRYNLDRIEIRWAKRIKESKEIYNEILKRIGNTFQPDFSLNIPKFNNKKISKNSLILENITFYSKEDQDIFFEWLQEIKCIKNIGYNKNILYLNIINNEISADDLENLKTIFVRYKIFNTQQLLKFKVKED